MPLHRAARLLGREGAPQEVLGLLGIAAHPSSRARGGIAAARWAGGPGPSCHSLLPCGLASTHRIDSMLVLSVCGFMLPLLAVLFAWVGAYL